MPTHFLTSLMYGLITAALVIQTALLYRLAYLPGLPDTARFWSWSETPEDKKMTKVSMVLFGILAILFAVFFVISKTIGFDGVWKKLNWFSHAQN